MDLQAMKCKKLNFKLKKKKGVIQCRIAYLIKTGTKMRADHIEMTLILALILDLFS